MHRYIFAILYTLFALTIFLTRRHPSPCAGELKPSVIGHIGEVIGEVILDKSGEHLSGLVEQSRQCFLLCSQLYELTSLLEPLLNQGHDIHLQDRASVNGVGSSWVILELRCPKTIANSKAEKNKRCHVFGETIWRPSLLGWRPLRLGSIPCPSVASPSIRWLFGQAKKEDIDKAVGSKREEGREMRSQLNTMKRLG